MDIMPELRYNKQLIKCLFKVGVHEAAGNYYHYLICKRHFYDRSGIFTLDALMDVLCADYGYKQLHHGPGNKRKRYRDTLRGQLRRSILFRSRPDGTFSIISEKRLGCKHSLRFPVHESDLLTKRAFIDGILGVLQGHNTFKGYERTARQTGFTVRRIMQANKRLVESGRLEKHNNLILVAGRPSQTAIEGLRQVYFTEWGICTPAPIKCRYRGKQTFWLAFYAANSYFMRDVLGDKGQGHFRDKKSGRRLKPMCEKERNYFSTGALLWEWTPAYTVNDYLNEHGRGMCITA